MVFFHFTALVLLCVFVLVFCLSCWSCGLCVQCVGLVLFCFAGRVLFFALNCWSNVSRFFNLLVACFLYSKTCWFSFIFQKFVGVVLLSFYFAGIVLFLICVKLRVNRFFLFLKLLV